MSIETMHIQRNAPEPTPLFAEFSVVELLAAIKTDDGADVPAGSHGTVVAEWGNGAAYEVEFARPVVGNATVHSTLLRAV